MIAITEMEIKSVSIKSLTLFFLLLVTAPSYGAFVDFEGLGLFDGDAIPDIGIVSFDGNAAVQGGTKFGFSSIAGLDTGTSAPFNLSGNTFITNPGGYASNETVKTLRMYFSVPVTKLSFLAADIDSSLPTIEQLTAEVFDGSSSSLGLIVITAPLTGDLGDGRVVTVDFGTVSGIRELEITLRNIGTNTEATSLGFGVDDLQYHIAAPVPLPSAIWLLGSSIFTLVFRGRKKKGE